MKIEKTEIWITCERTLTLPTDTDTAFDGGCEEILGEGQGIVL
jgi:hypothetical protein